MSSPPSQPADRDQASRWLINGHHLSLVVEYRPTSDISLPPGELSAHADERRRFWRCTVCGQERRHRDGFDRSCEALSHSSVLDRAGYTLDQPRTRRALTEQMDVRFVGQGGLYSVEGERGVTYDVDTVNQSCTCPDYTKRQPEHGCKHVRRVDLAIRAALVPGPAGTFDTL